MKKPSYYRVYMPACQSVAVLDLVDNLYENANCNVVIKYALYFSQMDLFN